MIKLFSFAYPFVSYVQVMHSCNADILYLSHARSFIPDEHMAWCPEQLLQCVLAHIHYMPDHWRGNANKSETRDEVAQLFQYKAVRNAETQWIGTHLSHSSQTEIMCFFWL